MRGYGYPYGQRPQKQQPRYSGAACRSGHLIATRVVDVGMRQAVSGWGQNPDGVPTFCPRCGSKVVLACEDCGTLLRGFPALKHESDPDQFCHGCGVPYPWTARDEMVRQLEDHLLNEQLEPNERLEAREALDTLTASADEVDDEARERAADRLRRLASQAWLTWATPVLRTVVTAELMRRLGLPPDG